MTIRPLEVKCETCGLSHYIKAPKAARYLSALAIDFDICPFCNTPRNMKLAKQYWGKPRCFVCGVPLQCFGDNGTLGMCKNHYVLLKKKLET